MRAIQPIRFLDGRSRTILPLLLAGCILAGAQDMSPALAKAGDAANSAPDFRNAMLRVRVDGTMAEPAPPAEIRPCDGTESTYTPETDTGEGKGEGTTIREAQKEACWDAVEKAAYAQFSCKTCPDDDEDDDNDKECEKDSSSSDKGGAVMSDPLHDCTYDSTTDTWTCEGEVNFQRGEGPSPEADAGCKECPEGPTSAEGDPIGQR